MCVFEIQEEEQIEMTTDLIDLFKRFKDNRNTDLTEKEIEEINPKEEIKDFTETIRDVLIEIYIDYDYNKENNKICPICDKKINYHTDGFYHDKILNIWICREHKLKDITKSIDLKDKELIQFIEEQEN